MKNIDNINLIVSKKNKISKDVVKKINQIYWRQIKSNLTNLTDTTVSAKGLANFTVSKYLLYNKIHEVIADIRFTRWSRRLTDSKKEKILAQHYEYLSKLLKQRNEIAIRYYERNIRIRKANSERIEKLSEDSGGSSEQCEEQSSLPS